MAAKKSSRSKAKTKSLKKKVTLKPVKPLTMLGDVTGAGHEKWIEINS